MDLNFLSDLPLKLRNCSKIPILKISIITVAIVLVLYIAGIALISSIDPNKYKDSIEKQVFEQTQKVFIINGPIHIQSFPWLAIELNDVKLKKKLTSKKNILTITKLKIYPKLSTLLQGAISFRLEIMEGKIKNNLIHSLKTNVSSENGMLELRDTKINLAGKDSNDDLEINLLKIDTRNEVPKYHLIVSNKDFKLKQLMDLIAPKTHLTGDTIIDMELMSEGTSIEGLKNKLSGHLELEISKGKFHGTDLIASLKEAKSVLETISSKLSHTLSDAINSLSNRKKIGTYGVTPFNHLKLKAKIQQGIMNSHELNISHHHYEVKGAGLFNIAKNTLNYQIEAIYKKKDKAQQSTHTKTRHTPLKIYITGPIEDPNVKPDFHSYLKYVR